MFKKKIKMKGIQEQLAVEEVNVAAAKEKLEHAKFEVQSLTRGLETNQM